MFALSLYFYLQFKVFSLAVIKENGCHQTVFINCMTQFNSFLSTLNSLWSFLHHCIIHVCHPLLIPVTNIIVMILFRINTSSHNRKRQKLKQLCHLALPGSRSGQRHGSRGEQAANLQPVANRSGSWQQPGGTTSTTASLILPCFREVKDWIINKGKKTHPVYFTSTELGLI